MTRKQVPPVDLARYGQLGPAAQNRLLLQWLEDDAARAALFRQLNAQRGGVLDFPSRDVALPPDPTAGVADLRPPPDTGHKTVRLVTARDRIETALRDDGRTWSSRPYAPLGGGGFMLALDPAADSARPTAHALQRRLFGAAFPHDPAQLLALAHAACQAAAPMSLRAPDFDLAAYAEESALRFVQLLMGYAARDFPLLERTLRAGYRGLVHQVLGRHFVTDPTAVPRAQAAMAELQTRTAALIDAYASGDADVLKGCHDPMRPTGLAPVLQALGGQGGTVNGEQLATLAVGAAVGTVGNVQAAVCIAVQALFADLHPPPRQRSQGRWQKARGLALAECGRHPTQAFGDWQALLAPALNDQPPIPFLPRWHLGAEGGGSGAAGEWLLALGGATQCAGPSLDDPLVWGLPTQGTHWCAGRALAWPLIVEIVRSVMALPGLAEQIDPEDGEVAGLTQRWGFACERYPLTHLRSRRVVQSSLNVAMRLKSPVHESAARVRAVIRAGAPRIEAALRASRHVHFAWFELVEGDSVLVLHTVYDGPFEAYVEHFALAVGDTFDALFECIEDPPPMPVDRFPQEFVAHIQRYNRAPATGFFFSAYPLTEAARIQRGEAG